MCRGPERFSASPAASGLGSGLGALVGVPSRPGTAPLSPVQRSQGSHCPRRAERSAKAHGAGTRTSSGFRATRAAGLTPSHFLRDRACQGPEIPPGKVLPSPGPQAPGLVRTPGSLRPPLTPVHQRCDCHSPAAKTWGSRVSVSVAAHLGQVRSGDSPSGGNRCSPAQQPGPRADPSVPLCAEGWPGFSSR